MQELDEDRLASIEDVAKGCRRGFVDDIDRGVVTVELLAEGESVGHTVDGENGVSSVRARRGLSGRAHDEYCVYNKE